MAYYIEPVDRDLLPTGCDWMFVEEPNGDICFVMARDVDRLLLPQCALEVLLEKIASHTELPLRLAL